MQNLSNENEFDLHENKPAGGIHFNAEGIARRLVLSKRQDKNMLPNKCYTPYSNMAAILVFFCFLAN